MSVKILVVDNNDRPMANQKVAVIWDAGLQSRRTTNQMGMADLECSGGLVRSIQVNDREVVSGIRLGDNDTFKVTRP